MRLRRLLGSALLPLAITATMLAGALVGGQADSPLPTPPTGNQGQGSKVFSDGKWWTKTPAGKVRMSASDFTATHDGVTRHAVGRAFYPPVSWDPPDASYPLSDWWLEAEVYLLHNRDCSDQVCVNYYKAGFDLFSWRGDYDTIFGDEETPAVNKWEIWLALVSHPWGGTLTANRWGPMKWYSSGGNYTCRKESSAVMVQEDHNVMLRANLVVRPVWAYWDSATAQLRSVPYGTVRRMTHSYALHADGLLDSSEAAAYTNVWSDAVGIPSLSGFGGYCGAEPIQEP